MVPYPSSSSSSTIRSSSSSSSNDNENHPNSESRATERMATLPSALRKFYAFFSDAFWREKNTCESANEKGKGVRFSGVEDDAETLFTRI
jgi:hypothetical protein